MGHEKKQRGPQLELTIRGNGAEVYRALARILVRREIFARSTPSATDCETAAAA